MSSSDEDDVDPNVVEENDSFEDEEWEDASDIEDPSDSMDELDESLDLSELEKLQLPGLGETSTEFISPLDDYISKLSLKDLIPLSCLK